MLHVWPRRLEIPAKLLKPPKATRPQLDVLIFVLGCFVVICVAVLVML